MNRNTRNFQRLLSAIFAVLPASILSGPAAAFNSSGLGPPTECSQYQVKSAVKFESGKALSADSAEYNFSVQMTEGSGGADCPNPNPGRYTAKIIGRWDGSSKRAYETIQHQSPAKGKLTEIVSSCPSNPWTGKAEPACALISSKADTTVIVDPGYAPAIAGPYPVSAYYIGYAGRKHIADTISWVGSSDFILPPTTPPQIIAADDGMDIDGRFYRRNQDVKASINRPSDCSPKWFEANLKSYDVEVQVKNGGGDIKSLAWTSKSIVSSVPSSSPSLTLPYARLFDDPESNWSIENFGARGNYRSVRVRARVHDATIVRPWSSWRMFEVEVPLRLTKAPGGARPQIPGADLGGKAGVAPIVPPTPTPTPPVLSNKASTIPIAPATPAPPLLSNKVIATPIAPPKSAPPILSNKATIAPIVQPATAPPLLSNKANVTPIVPTTLAPSATTKAASQSLTPILKQQIKPAQGN